MEIGTMAFQPLVPGRPSGEHLTVLEAARRAGVTQAAIVRWIRNGYLSATPSQNGWQIPADQLAQAAAAANDARGTGPVPRRTMPSLTPTPIPIRRSIEQRAVSTPSPEEIGEHIVAPLAELIRDQIEVVHDQAEVIGWLQSERERLTSELAKLQHARLNGQVTPTALPAARPESHQVYDEVLSLLWKQDDMDNGEDRLELEEPSQRTASVAVFDQEIEPFCGPILVAADDTGEDENEDVSDEHGEHAGIPVPMIEDFNDPALFFGIAEPRYDSGIASRPRPTLQPIVPRSEDVLSIEPANDDELVLHQMIDETERKIAELWRAQEELRTAVPNTVELPQEIVPQRPVSAWRRILRL